jgi:Fe-S cluster assembly protein SufD
MSNKKEAFVAQFVTENLPAGGQEVRKQAAESLNTLDLPTTRWEAWKYTSLRPVLAHTYQSPAPARLSDVDAFRIPDLDAHLLVFVNGHYAPELSSADAEKQGVIVSRLSALSTDEKALFEEHYGKVVAKGKDIFAALNTAYASEGVWVHVKKAKAADKPLHIMHLGQIGEAAAIQSRNLFVVEETAEVKIIESFHSTNQQASFRNHVTEIVVGANASCEYVKIQSEDPQAMMVDRTEIHQSTDSRMRTYTLSMHGAWIRNNLHFHLNGKNTESILNGLYMLDGEQHVDNHTTVDHLQPNCYSDELYKGILRDKATAAFRGKIHVHQPAQQTNAYQSNRNILLSDEASINTKPQLEIYADDVKCSHGATTGQIDEDALFYLQARGIPKEAAQKLMVYAFAAEVVEKISMEPVVAYIDELIEKRFA